MHSRASASVTGAKPAEVKELHNYQCFRVVVEDTALVPAKSEMIAAAKALDKCDGALAILEPTLELVQRSKRLVGRLLVKMDGPILIRVLNPTSYPRWVNKNILAARCELIDRNQVDGELWLGHSQKAETEVRVTRGSQPKECRHQDQQRSLPSELEELLNRSTDGLNADRSSLSSDSQAWECRCIVKAPMQLWLVWTN